MAAGCEDAGGLLMGIPGRQWVSRSISKAISAAYSFCPHEIGYRVLMYHSVGANALGDERGLFSISASVFEQHMAALAENCRTRTLADISAGQGGASLKDIVVTFDDGYRDNLYVALPILEKFGIPFSVFVSTAFVQKQDPRFLSPEDVRTLSQSPLATIGAHGHTHVPLTRCDDAQLKNELESSRRYLEDLLGRKVGALAYPYGETNRRVRDAASGVGYDLGVCSYEGVNDARRDILLLKRTAVLSTDSLHIFKQKLCGDWDWRKWAQRDPAME